MTDAWNSALRPRPQIHNVPECLDVFLFLCWALPKNVQSAPRWSSQSRHGIVAARKKFQDRYFGFWFWIFHAFFSRFRLRLISRSLHPSSWNTSIKGKKCFNVIKRMSLTLNCEEICCLIKIASSNEDFLSRGRWRACMNSCGFIGFLSFDLLLSPHSAKVFVCESLIKWASQKEALQNTKQKSWK